MKGNITRRGGSSWRLSVFMGADEVTGKRRYAQKTVHGTKREAQTELATMVSEVSQGRYAMPGSVSLAELLERWMELKTHQVGQTTHENYGFLVEHYIAPGIGKVKIGKLRAADLDRFYSRLLASGGEGGKPLSPRTVQMCHRVIRQALAQGRKWSLVPVNVAEDATPPRLGYSEVHPPSPEQVQALLAAAMDYDPDFGTYLRVLAATGCRRGEAVALRWRDLTLDPEARRGEVSISHSIAKTSEGILEKDTKTHQSRRLVIDAGTVRVLCEHRKRCHERAAEARTELTEDSFVFSSAVDASVPWRPDVMTNRFIRLCQHNDITGVRLHDLRHYVATSLGAAGTPIATISTRLGHRDRATTLNIYSHSLPALDAQAAEVIGRLLEPVESDGAG